MRYEVAHIFKKAFFRMFVVKKYVVRQPRYARARSAKFGSIKIQHLLQKTAGRAKKDILPTVIMHSTLTLLFPLLTSSTAFLSPTKAPLSALPTSKVAPPLDARKRNSDTSSSDDDKPSVSSAKLAALEGVLGRIERNYGRGSIVKLGDADRMVVDCFGSGSLTLGTCRICVDMCCKHLMLFDMWQLLFNSSLINELLARKLFEVRLWTESDMRLVMIDVLECIQL